MDVEEPLRPGIILLVHVENFVTYTSADLIPGPHLNMILGPNGTGKSTMVAAIILGLGGSPKNVGRGTKVSEYVKHYCEESTIEITLHDPSAESGKLVISRQFNLEDKNVWKINNKKVAIGDIKECKKKFNIQVDNLCQFLPQDRVQEFAKLNKQQLLKQTQSALCRDDLDEKQMKLIEITESVNKHKGQLEKNIQKLQEAKDAIVRLEGKVANFKRKKKLQGYIKDIDRKIAWKDYEEIVLRRNELKEDKRKAEDILKMHKNSAEPTEKAIAAARAAITKFNNKAESTEVALKRCEEQLTRCTSDVTTLTEEIENIKRNAKGRLEEIKMREAEIRNNSMKLNTLQTDKNEIYRKYGSGGKLQENIEKHSEQLKKNLSTISKLEVAKTEFSTLKREKVYERNNLEQEIQRIENVKQQRLAWLQQRDQDAYRAVCWLKQNRLEFVGKVYDPMMLELNVNDPKHAVYIENIIGFRDKVAFLCTERADMNMLIRVLRDQQKFSVNIIHCEDRENEPLHMYQPQIPIEQLRKFGLYAYLNTLVTGPTAIMKFLCKNYNIHQIPIGDHTTNGCFQNVPSGIKCFFSDKNRFSISFSRYNNEKSSRQNEVHTDGSLSISVDTRRIDQIRGQLEEINRACTRFDGDVARITENIEKISELSNKTKDVLKEMKSSVNLITNIDSKIRLVNETIERMRSDSVTEEQINDETKTKIQQVLERMLTIQPTLRNHLKEFHNNRLAKQLTAVEISTKRKTVVHLENKIMDIRRASEDAERLVDDLSNRYATVTREAKAVLQKAKGLSNNFTPEDEGFEAFREMYDKLPDDQQGLTEEKEHLIRKVQCLTTADDDEMQEYERRLQETAELEEKITTANTLSDDMDGKMERLERSYMEPLTQLVAEINDRFSWAYERMGCAGEVGIYTGDNPKDYANYGISIKVTYRNGEPLQELNGVTQSGGEKAVATATYMLSLQELTPVPFRCVDEINQGMDETNERRIFDLLTESTSRPNTAQYFLITPKLVPKLKFVPTMKIHFVHNGPFVPTQAEWNAAANSVYI